MPKSGRNPIFFVIPSVFLKNKLGDGTWASVSTRERRNTRGDAMPGMHIDSNVEFKARERVFGDTSGTNVGVIDAMNVEHAIALKHIAMLEEKIAQLESENLMHKYPDNCDLIDHNLYEGNARAAAAPEAAGPFAAVGFPYCCRHYGQRGMPPCEHRRRRARLVH